MAGCRRKTASIVIWLGEEGELFRETIPTVALTAAPADEEELDGEDDELEHEEQDREEDHEEVDEDEVKPAKGKRKTA